jgi:hypothetical protein
MRMEAIRFSEMSILTTTTQRNIHEDGIFHSHLHENLKSYTALTGWVLQRRSNVSPVRYELGFYTQKTVFFIVTAVKTSDLTQH